MAIICSERATEPGASKLKPLHSAASEIRRERIERTYEDSFLSSSKALHSFHFLLNYDSNILISLIKFQGTRRIPVIPRREREREREMDGVGGRKKERRQPR